MSLFDLTPFSIPELDVTNLSAGRRRTIKARLAIEAERHPANGLPINREHTCGDCANLDRVIRGNHGNLLKCDHHRLGASFSEASDMRAGWPACPHWEAL